MLLLQTVECQRPFLKYPVTSFELMFDLLYSVHRGSFVLLWDLAFTESIIKPDPCISAWYDKPLMNKGPFMKLFVESEYSFRIQVIFSGQVSFMGRAHTQRIPKAGSEKSHVFLSLPKIQQKKKILLWLTSSEVMLRTLIIGYCYVTLQATDVSQWQINNSSKCSNCYGPRAFGGPEVFCNESYFLHYI